ncbi:uncharacterized protein BCR38DRAFT_429224 [Pseudomassariella vexata]|uniref:25S rRNA (Uridine(2843)-N(3))-methyltransferase n=1 Tax=Pseudomassariella vexata TaxID=1141098 RepID=A0A1Y2E416_9PEZI|nr:uncharacterized protein BCR38DRAFT_429224 [Pseudomassariella vexata]ORY66094.1 hypothetical protein BCR38DRAFT_429224 [Pseudomassariella vexata]
MKKFERKAQSERKHGPLSVSSASKAPVAPPSGRPGWKGPSYIKKAPRQLPKPSSPQGPASVVQEQLLPVELQQLVLDIFRDTFPASYDFDALKPTLQEIKDALIQRNFDRAFGKAEFLEAYAIRWSPSRALAYSNLLAWVCGERAEEIWVKRLIGITKDSPANVVCFGGGAAEIMAFAGLLRHLRAGAAGRPNPPEDVSEELEALSMSESTATSTSTALNLHLVDSANWSSVVSKLHAALTTPPTLSKYASAAARVANASFLSSDALKSTFTQGDILESGIEDLSSMIGPEPALLTLMFTLNELYTASMPKTIAFLLKLTTAAPKGSLLLVIDSAGSCSETTKKKYPMSWLMDHTMLSKRVKNGERDEDEGEGEETTSAWEKVVNEESTWFRLAESLKYPVSLENMRFQVHLFKRL